MPLEKDNPSHRSFSNSLDDTFGGGFTYKKLVCPVIHGAYHAAHFVGNGNNAEWARAKDQFSAVGKGQPCNEYLNAHQEAQKQEESSRHQRSRLE